MCSKAMALHAEGETRVFGDEFGVVQSLWHIIEKPELIKSKHVTKIWNPDDHPDGDLNLVHCAELFQ
ncbi:hypothetical protein SNOG_07610 [Parastagonospora nodorum SN15]|uniref:Uncharacterized protein n=1 Tax=Phaeosphaeria nodorum (strain SN15 / ATCC MYA-4574 / FGSC 10173) TaxID=321614 RepID=Q0UKV4_PHANO|nr:hypothetical protein SNOG_07610 [Parastagonospora nodorum SN15]EAT85076.1 hypothetical protein SNOG_07610 [Parastagonospora nodorum SN15]